MEKHFVLSTIGGIVLGAMLFIMLFNAVSNSPHHVVETSETTQITDLNQCQYPIVRGYSSFVEEYNLPDNTKTQKVYVLSAILLDTIHNQYAYRLYREQYSRTEDWIDSLEVATVKSRLGAADYILWLEYLRHCREQ